MARIRIPLPAKFSFVTVIPIRITDLNYGGHVGNDKVLAIIHEARFQFLVKHGYTELNIEGIGLIMSDVAIEFKTESFYGDQVIASVAAEDFTGVSFDLVYKLEKQSNDGSRQPIAVAKTRMVCYDYDRKKIAALPSSVKEELQTSL